MGPVIYLDIDGVLCPRRLQSDFDLDAGLPGQLARERACPAIADLDPVLVNEVNHGFSPEACRLVRQLCEEFGARIIVTSSWRNVFSSRQLAAILAIAGLGEYMIGATPAGLHRPSVIRASMEELGISSYCVIDDMDMRHDFGSRSIVPRHVFDQACAQKVRRIFKSDSC